MEYISPKYMMTLTKKVKAELIKQYSDSDIRAYLKRWMEYYDAFNQSFGFCLNDNGDLDLDSTLSNIDDETLLKIAIDLEIDTPDFIPCIPTFKNELKSSYQTAGKTFELAYRKVNSEPGSAVALSNSALESIIKEILKDERVNYDGQYNPRDTLEDLIKKCLKKLNAFPKNNISENVRNLGSGLIKCCIAIEKLRSDETLETHGKTDDDFVIDDPTVAMFVVNAVTTIGLLLIKQYQKAYPIQEIQEINDEEGLPF